MIVFRLLKTACALGAVLLIAACGSQDDSIETPIVRPTSAAPAGVYEGTLTDSQSTENVTAFLNGDSTFMLFNADGSLIASGVYAKTDQARGLTWTARLFREVTIPGTPDDPSTPADESTDPTTGQAITSIVAGGTYDEQSAIQMTFTERDASGASLDSGSLALSYDSVAYESRSDVSLIQGSWGLKDQFGTPTTSISIDAGGTFSGADEDGCNYSGAFSVIDQHYNLYAVRLQTQCTGSATTVTTTGLATLKKAVTGSATPSLVSVSASSKLAVLWQLKPL
ncbi:hypothetical protein [Solimonas terrae]|uniref:Lipocalin-like domain-containing protein n=1 Tax=Solimonas terrae TaxID=1396819 RepID=A0A6M2BNX1_9GAMM|nr:hypothetical protein [Solimonas terrae]NGY03747.1 hypothetical protein [Solimonas terrae]